MEFESFLTMNEALTGIVLSGIVVLGSYWFLWRSDSA